MKNLKNNRFDFASFVLLLVQGILFAGIAVVVFISIPNSSLAIVLITINLSLTLLSSLYYDYINKKNLSKYSAEINKAIEVIKRDEKWENSNLYYNDDLMEVYGSIKSLYDSLRKKEADRTSVLNMVNDVTSNMEIEKLFEALMPKLVENLNSNWGAFYLANNATGKLELKSALGFSKNIYNEFDLTIGEGLIGSAAVLKEITILRDIPDNTIFVTKTFLGKINPKNIMIVPVINNDQLIGVLCMASIYDYTNEQTEIVNMIKYYLGIALGNCVIFERTKRLTNELQFQNSLIQSLNEELENKVSDRNIFLKNIIDSIKDYSIYVIDKQGIILEWNKGSELLLGYTEDEVKGKHINVIFSDEEVSSGRVKSRMNMVMQHGYYTENGWRYKKDGSKYYAEASLFGLYNDHNELIGMTNVSKDITKLKIAENEIWFQKDFTKKLVEGSKRALIITDGDCNIQICNQQAISLLRYENPIGEKIWSFIENEELMSELEKEAMLVNIKTKVRLISQDEYIYTHVNSIRDELAIMETYVFYFYTIEEFEEAHS